MNDVELSCATHAAGDAMINTIRVFLASSQEMAAERDLVELAVWRKNRNAIQEEIFLEVVRWEELLRSFHGIRVQEYFNDEVASCNAMFVLFHREVGEFTKEELNTGYKRFKDGLRPNFIFVLFKHDPSNAEIDDGVSQIREMKDQIKEHQQIFSDFTSAESLELLVMKQLDHVLDAERRKAERFAISRELIVSHSSRIPIDDSTAMNILDQDGVRALAESIGLFRKWSVNPHLAFEEGDILYFHEQQVSRASLETQLRARFAVLEHAEKRNISIADPGDLSALAKAVELRLLDAWQGRIVTN